MEYFVIVKTSDAEIRALENTNKTVLKNFVPIIEITRGRKKKVDSVISYPFDKKVSRFEKLFNKQTIAIDLTSEESLMSDEVRFLYDFEDGYSHWVNYVLELSRKDTFSSIIPSIISNFNDGDFESNFVKQIKCLSDNFDALLYRNSIRDPNGVEDIKTISKCINKNTLVYVMIDCGPMISSACNSLSEVVEQRLKQINEIDNFNSKIIVCSTSFPNNVRDYVGDEECGRFDMSEVILYERIRKVYPQVLYGDYASINPQRNDTIIMAKGWIPRIDVAMNNYYFFYKRRRGAMSYSQTYSEVAKLVVEDERFPNDMKDNWGVKQIKMCASGYAPGSSPSFWISVRMNMHIEQQVNRLKLIE